MIRQRFGVHGLRVFRLLLLHPQLEQAQIHDKAMLGQKVSPTPLPPFCPPSPCTLHLCLSPLPSMIAHSTRFTHTWLLLLMLKPIDMRFSLNMLSQKGNYAFCACIPAANSAGDDAPCAADWMNGRPQKGHHFWLGHALGGWHSMREQNNVWWQARRCGAHRIRGSCCTVCSRLALSACRMCLALQIMHPRALSTPGASTMSLQLTS